MGKRTQAGQALLIVVLIMVIVLTVSLAIVARTITNLRTTNDDDNSQQAFSAAEAGIDRAIKSNCINPSDCPDAITGSFTTDKNKSVSYTTSVTPLAGVNSFYVRGKGAQIEEDQGADVWLSQYDPDPTKRYTNPQSGTVTIYWGRYGEDACSTAALEIIAITGDKTNPIMKRYTIDPCDARRGTNGFCPKNTVPDCLTISNGSSFPDDSGYFNYSTSLTFSDSSKGILLRIIPLYTNTILGAKGICQPSGACDPFYSQGKQIESIGTVGIPGSSQTKRKITYFQGYAELPVELLQYSLLVPKPPQP